MSDAFAHCKFVGYSEHAGALFEAAGLDNQLDDGFIRLGPHGSSGPEFLETCGAIRYWARRPGLGS